MATAAKKAKGVATRPEGVSLSTLIEHLGTDAANEFFNRVDDAQRDGQEIVGLTVRESRVGFSRAHTSGHAQFVMPIRTGVDRAPSAVLSDSLVVMKMDDFAAVVRAGRNAFDWTREFAPRAGLAAATTTPTLKRSSRGRRQFHG